MNDRNWNLPAIAAGIIGTLLIGLISWWWISSTHEEYQVVGKVSEAATENNFLAAQRLLERRHHKVFSYTTLSLALDSSMHSGMLIIADGNGLINSADTKRVLDWVAKGNVLVTSPKITYPAAAASKTPIAKPSNPPQTEQEARNKDDEEDNEDEGPTTSGPKIPANLKSSDSDPEADSIGAHFDLTQSSKSLDYFYCPRPDKKSTVEPKYAIDKASLTCNHEVQVPGHDLRLQIAADTAKLVPFTNGREPIWADQSGSSVRAYRHGRGLVVFTVQNLFNNENLRLFDDGEFLLALADLAPGEHNVTIAQHLAAKNWWSILWGNFKYALVMAGVIMALLLWRSVVRFGPILPEPRVLRRSLMEHVGASSRWLWKSEAGRQQLLDAARSMTIRVISRRVPNIGQLSSNDRVQILADATGFSIATIDDALLQAPATTPYKFTIQIRTLQKLRNHYERKS